MAESLQVAEGDAVTEGSLDVDGAGLRLGGILLIPGIGLFDFVGLRERSAEPVVLGVSEMVPVTLRVRAGVRLLEKLVPTLHVGEADTVPLRLIDSDLLGVLLADASASAR